VIRDATQEDLAHCLDAGMAKNTGIQLSDIDKPMICVELDGYRMCALVYTLDGDAEVHPITPRVSAIKSRDLARELIKYLGTIGIKRIYTTIAPDFKRVENLARKLGFEKTGGDVWVLAEIPLLSRSSKYTGGDV
jgi:hypothetical protein